METLAPYFAYIAALGIAAVIPGPGIAALVGQALGGNQRASTMFLAGIALGDVTYLTVAVVGLAAIAKTFASAFIVIKFLGAAYLLYLAYKFWTSEGALTHVKRARAQSDGESFLAGYFVTLGNPKTIVFYLALLPTVLDLNNVHVTQWAILSVLTILVIFSALAPYMLLASKARTLMTQPKALKRLNRFAAAFIGGAGSLILAEATSAALRRA
ncbi:LysE family translocator [Cognatishimia maritima]|uniref:Threonine/homoserine/homoserine lactone efflux protein n=1 Tax=Cognatishimia maritima TaxID=870908 RepID=A0A1M5MQ12_9RHOB|nr:LysE family translocator [Cognatishimia maritima]SHG79388.1 Threonine/homoserine/homoserine lactone efflux protein [Cognatishimia maritima]